MTFTYLTESALITVDVFTDFVETYFFRRIKVVMTIIIMMIIILTRTAIINHEILCGSSNNKVRELPSTSD